VAVRFTILRVQRVRSWFFRLRDGRYHDDMPSFFFLQLCLINGVIHPFVTRREARRRLLFFDSRGMLYEPEGCDARARARLSARPADNTVMRVT